MIQEPGCNTKLDYVEQSCGMLFLKYLDDQDQERADKDLNTELTGQHKAIREPLIHDMRGTSA